MRRSRRNQVQVFRKLKIQNSDISWLGDASICKKRHMHYPAFLRNGKLIPVRSFVFIMHEDEVNHYLGYLEDMYEEEISKEKKIQIRWFCHNKEVKDLVTPLLNAHSEEVFITSDVQVIAAEYVDRIGGVLSPSHYDKCLAAFLLPDNNLSYGRTFMCHRQLIKNKKVRPFSMRKLRGYDNQAILSALDRHCGELKLQKLNEARESGEEEPPRKPLLTWSLRNRRSGLNRNCGSTSNPIVKNQGENIEQFQEPRRIKLVGSKDSDSEEDEDEEEEEEEDEEEDEEEEEEEKNIELLCQDSGFRGCWFRCKILETSEENRIKVQYYDVQDSDKSGKLEEWVPESREATPDKLNMRCAGRLTVRPWPPQNFSLLNCSFEIGDAVDAWWGDGWWECVVVGFDKSRTDTNVQVFLPGENKFLSFERKDLRISRDWINEEWVEIKGNPEIHASIASTIASSIGQNVKYPNPKPYSAPNPMMESATDRPGTSNDVPMQIIKPAAVSVTSNGYATAASGNCLNPKKRRLLGFS